VVASLHRRPGTPNEPTPRKDAVMTTNLSAFEVDTIQRSLKKAMNALDACGQDDLADEVKVIFKKVAARAFPTASRTES
jgi:hypothetical protein